MKTAIALMLAVSTFAVNAADQFLVTRSDCQGIALIAKAAVMSRDAGVPLEHFLGRVSDPKRMEDPGYKAMYPMVQEAVNESFVSTVSADASSANQLAHCERYIGKPPQH